MPNNITDDKSLCILVFGYQLKPDGEMDVELIYRLEKAKMLADKYTNAYIAVSGGATAENYKNKTEGDLMAKWLLDKKIDRERLIVEKEALTTVQNVQNIYKIVSTTYKSIDKFIVVSSSYHIKRASLLLYTEIMRQHIDNGKSLMQVIGNFAYKSDKEDKHFIPSDVGALNFINITKDDKVPEISIPVDLVVKSDLFYNIGEVPSFIVFAQYSCNFIFDVTLNTNHSSIDINSPGKKTVRFEYKYRNNTVNSTYYIYYTAKGDQNEL